MARLRINGECIAVEGCSKCSTCGTIKVAEAFYKDRSRPTGCSSRCKSCETARDRTRTQKYSLTKELKELAAAHPHYRSILLGASARLAA